MARFLRKRDASFNQPPGSMIHPIEGGSQAREEDVKIHLLNYNSQRLDEMLVPDLSSSQKFIEDEDTIVWLDVEGLTDLEVVKEIGKTFDIDSLYLEDVLNTDHRPKAEDLSDLLFIIIKSIYFEKGQRRRVRFEQISLFLGDQFVVSFHERKSPIFDVIKDRLRKGKGRVRSNEAAYLFYTLVDVVVDNYFQVVESLGSEIEDLDLKLIDTASKQNLVQLNQLKSEILFLRKSILPLRETLLQILRSDREDISDRTRVYLRDTLDHVVQICDAVESYRDMITGLAEVARTAANREMNEIMKFLTIFTTIFIPPTFVSSIYGMNFDFMPELHWKYSYFVVWGVVLAMILGMIFYFRRKDWI